MKASFIIPWAGNDYPVVIGSILNQTRKEFEIILVYDGEPELFELNQMVQLNYKYPNIKWASIPGPNGHGDVARAHGLTLVSDDSDVVIFTGSDNYYMPEFLNAMLPMFDREATIAAYCNMYHNNRDWEKTYTSLECGVIDCGCFVERTSIAKDIGWNNWGALSDWLHIEKIILQYGRDQIIKVERSLYVHN